MDEITKTDEVVIKLPKEAIEWLERALQWPEDLEVYDRLNMPLKISLDGQILN